MHYGSGAAHSEMLVCVFGLQFDPQEWKGEETLCVRAAAPLARTQRYPDALQTMGPRTHFRFQQNVQGLCDQGERKKNVSWSADMAPDPMAESLLETSAAEI